MAYILPNITAVTREMEKSSIDYLLSHMVNYDEYSGDKSWGKDSHEAEGIFGWLICMGNSQEGRELQR